MELSSDRTVILGSFAFLVFWVTATFPKFRGLPVGRTAGAIVSAALTVVFQVESPEEAYASINLPILGLLFGTMVVSAYLQRADMFRYLSSALSYRCRGGKDLLCRLSFLVALTSALFTNDTCCVLFTEFILGFCTERGLPPEPFLLALASSANLGSSATPIGNPQNLVIAIQSKISFGRFLLGMLPAMLLGVSLNLALLLAMYWKQLSTAATPTTHNSEPESLEVCEIRDLDIPSLHSQHDIEAGKDRASTAADSDDPAPIVTDGDETVAPNQGCHPFKSCFIGNHVSPSDQFHESTVCPPSTDRAIVMELAQSSLGLDNMQQDLLLLNDSNKSPSLTVVGCAHVVCVDSDGDSLAAQQDSKSMPIMTSFASHRTAASTTTLPESSLTFVQYCTHGAAKAWKRRIWKLSVYFVTLGMLAALLAGLDLSWSAITAAVALIVLDFEDAAPSLGKVSYSLLVFFSAMFITVDGLNRTGLPGKFWSVVEPHARTNHASGTAVLTAVVILLSNIASNVPTVLLLGPRVAASSMAIPGVSVTRAWLILAWASTVGGNLTLVGSAANLIVSEQARTAKDLPCNLSFGKHLKFGLPSTLLTVAAGLPLIRG